MTKKKFLKRMNALTEKAYDMNVDPVFSKTQRIIVSTMFFKEQHSAKVSIFLLDEEGDPKTCATYYDEHDKNEINLLFNL